MDALKQYFADETELMSQLDLRRVEQIIGTLERARSDGRRVFVFGNGGSAATASHLASHLACDLGVRESARANALPQMRVNIVPAAFGDDAPLWGAVALAQTLTG